MPTLRLDKVLAEEQIKIEEQPQAVKDAIARLRAKGQTFDKLDAQTASDLRAIIQAFKISLSDLFVSKEKFYRLKIIELIKDKYSDQSTLNAQLESLQRELTNNNKISFLLLSIYATQVLPESLLKGSDLKQICKTLRVKLDDLREEALPPTQTISVEAHLNNLDIKRNEFATLLDIPQKFVPWINATEILCEIVCANPSRPTCEWCRCC